MSKKITATLNGQVFSRRTDRKYVNAIIARLDYARELKVAKKIAEWDIANNWAYYLRTANPAATEADLAHLSASAVADIKALVALGKEGALRARIEQAQAPLDADRAKGVFDQLFAYAWTGRPDLAVQQAEKARREGFVDVVIVDVDG